MGSTLKTVFFQENPIYYLETGEGINLVLIRPLCEALGVDADWQIRELKTDDMLSGEVCEHTTRLPSEDRARPYTCLPEEFIYGWIFGIKQSNTMKPETRAALTAYKRECYDILYQHFHGKIRQAQREVTRKASNAAEIARLRQQIEANSPEQVQRLHELEAENKLIGNPLQRLQNAQFKLDYDQAAGSGEPNNQV
ncbi:MAG: phage antirepressor N-terminal domain-containing protein [Janthinobacterium lividum]